MGNGRSVNVSNAVLDGVIGGWTLGAIAELQAGAPWGAIEQTNLTNTFSNGVRPNLTCDPEIEGNRSRNDYLNQWFDTSCFQAPPARSFGNAARNVGFGPGQINIDSSVNKKWSITERYRLLFRADFFNVLNRPNFNVPAAVRGRGDFGRITSTRGTGRQIQLSMRFEF